MKAVMADTLNQASKIQDEEFRNTKFFFFKKKLGVWKSHNKFTTGDKEIEHRKD